MNIISIEKFRSFLAEKLYYPDDKVSQETHFNLILDIKFCQLSYGVPFKLVNLAKRPFVFQKKSAKQILCN